MLIFYLYFLCSNIYQLLCICILMYVFINILFEISMYLFYVLLALNNTLKLSAMYTGQFKFNYRSVDCV